jgi:glycine/D-amino acid oxidase-like deaminating enzyme/nitrite reductase/ring-hydroxylating ferredoxin subunit
MTETTSRGQSLWLDTAEPTNYPQLSGEIDVDVAVIGGGVAGLTAALMLQADGATVAVLEAERVATGVTGCTTAKVSALQGTMYSALLERHSERAASSYAEASLAGVARIAENVATYSIQCDLERRPAYTYAARPQERAAVKREADAAARAGLPIEFVEAVDLPYPVHGAVRLPDQLQLHPVRYVQGLAAQVHGHGGHVFELSRALGVHEGRRMVVRTEAGAVRAEHVVVASHFPFLDRGGYFARLNVQRSYCIAARLASGAPPFGMAISAGSPVRSVRGHDALLIVGGEGHATGDPAATTERFDRLAAFAREHWDVDEITHRWSAQDPTHYDELPLIGPYYPGARRLWVTAAFMKWGFATSTFGAMILADGIAGRSNPWADTFSPSRLSATSLPGVARLGAKFTASLVGDRLRPPQQPTSDDIPRGTARVVADGLGRKGVYRDDRGVLHAVSVRCTHLGCLLRFNGAERSWDCPCHGSRFDVDGAVLEGPAVHPLERRDP